MKYHYDIKVSQPLSAHQKALIRQIVADEIDQYVYPVEEVDPVGLMGELARKRSRLGEYITYKTLGISYKQLGLSSADRNMIKNLY